MTALTVVTCSRVHGHTLSPYAMYLPILDELDEKPTLEYLSRATDSLAVEKLLRPLFHVESYWVVIDNISKIGQEFQN